MPRSLIDTQTGIFRKLEDYVLRRHERLDAPSLRRYLEGNDDTDRMTKYAVLVAKMEFGPYRALTAFEFDESLYLICCGFEFAQEPSGYFELEEVHSAHLALLLTESRVVPRVSALEVRNFIEAGSMDDAGYLGHSSLELRRMLPEVRVFRAEGASDGDLLDQCFLSMCLEESAAAGSWMQPEFVDELRSLCEMAVPQMPYRAICLSVFDFDPRTMYLAIYRCIEAAYAYRACSALSSSLSLGMRWDEVATHLAKEIRWRPKEQDSLAQVLRMAVPQDLDAICAALEVTPGADLPASAAKGVYDLRNRLVHFGPSLDHVEPGDYDWNLLCVSLLRVMFHVFSSAFDPAGGGTPGLGSG